MATKEQLKSYFASGQTITEAHMNALIDACFNNGDNNIEIEIVQDIPTTLLPRQKVWCVATQSEWIGADPDNGVFPTLQEGTAWPVRGYKELACSITELEDEDPVLVIQKSDFSSVTLARTVENNYQVITDATSLIESTQKYLARFNTMHLYAHHSPLYYSEEAGVYIYTDIESVLHPTNPASDFGLIGIETVFFQADVNLKHTVTKLKLSSFNIEDPYFLPVLYLYPPAP